ncbi:NAD-dependent epimerase/dehydratase family protein [Mycobacterium kiyosense]
MSPTRSAQRLGGVDAVIHLAAIIPPASERIPDIARRVNLDATCRLIELMAESRAAKRLVFASSIGIFGDVQDREPPPSRRHTGTSHRRVRTP